jgi:flagellar biosynthesis protein FlhF
MMKFIASDLEAGKMKARRALGEQATIVSVRELPSGDVEVTASDKPAPSAPEPAPKANFAGAARDAVDEGPFRMTAGARLNESIEHRFSEDALARLTGALSGGDKKGRGLDMSDDAVKAMAEILAPHGLGETLLAALVKGARQSRIDEDLYRLEAAFDDTFQFAPLHFAPTAPIMLVGPTGAGKTSCCAKLAASASQDGSKPLMMTADVGRAGAVEQIRSYSEALGADYFIIESPMDVAQVMRNERPSGAVILDTPGVSPYDAADVAALKSYREASGAEPVLVLPASGDAAEYTDWAIAFRDIGVTRCIVTKFDATKRVGAALCAAYEGSLALAHFSETPFISEGLLTASPEFLARRMIASRPGKVG